ncbi:M28 family peptidase [Patulibacter defluvii]|uniref:M28 family peptidase n=1 Tax=Patulibacter defluvii TaxID=3095358 RepID=UPI002A7614FA|nr:M28 family peptidase [Patulibacter sp. DM4]
MRTRTVPGAGAIGRWLLATVVAVVGLGFVTGTAVAAPTATPTPAAPGVPSTAEILGWTTDLVDLGPRRTGTPGGRRAADYVADHFRRFGLQDVHFEEATSYRWQAERHGLRVGGTAFDSFPSQHSFIGGPTWTGRFSTGPGGRSAELVDVGDGDASGFGGKDVRGKIVLFNLRFQVPNLLLALVMEHLFDPQLSLFTEPETVLQANPYLTNYVTALNRAQAAGAVGFVGVLADYFDSNRYHNEYYRRQPVTVPGLWVTAGVGAQIRSRLRDGQRQATIDLEGDRRAVTARTVVGALPGSSRETIMIQSHHDSIGPGAVEDATGTAEVLALAKRFGAEPAGRRRKTLLFTTFDSHFTGYQSHEAFVRKYLWARSTPYDIVANVTLEHIARNGRVKDGRLLVTDKPEPRGVFRGAGLATWPIVNQAIAEHGLDRTLTLSAATLGGMPTDADPIYRAGGVPTISLISGPVYMYDDLDTIDKVHVPSLRPVAAAFSQVVDRMDALSKAQLREPPH